MKVGKIMPNIHLQRPERLDQRHEHEPCFNPTSVLKISHIYRDFETIAYTSCLRLRFA